MQEQQPIRSPVLPCLSSSTRTLLLFHNLIFLNVGFYFILPLFITEKDVLLNYYKIFEHLNEIIITCNIPSYWNKQGDTFLHFPWPSAKGTILKTTCEGKQKSCFSFIGYSTLYVSLGHNSHAKSLSFLVKIVGMVCCWNMWNPAMFTSL